MKQSFNADMDATKKRYEELVDLLQRDLTKARAEVWQLNLEAQSLQAKVSAGQEKQRLEDLMGRYQ